MNKLAKVLSSLAMILLCSRYALAGDKTVKTNEWTRLTHDVAVEWSASFLDSIKICYTRRSPSGRQPREIQVVDIVSKEKTTLLPCENEDIRIIDVCRKYYSGVLGLREGIVFVADYKDEPSIKEEEAQKYRTGIFIFDGKNCKRVFDSEDLVQIEGFESDKLYITTYPAGYPTKAQTYSVFLDGKKEKDMIPPAIEERRGLIKRLREELGVNMVYDFITDENGNITDVLVAYNEDRIWDLYVVSYKGRLKLTLKND